MVTNIIYSPKRDTVVFISGTASVLSQLKEFPKGQLIKILPLNTAGILFITIKTPLQLMETTKMQLAWSLNITMTWKLYINKWL